MENIQNNHEGWNKQITLLIESFYKKYQKNKELAFKNPKGQMHFLKHQHLIVDGEKHSGRIVYTFKNKRGASLFLFAIKKLNLVIRAIKDNKIIIDFQTKDDYLRITKQRIIDDFKLHGEKHD